MLVPIPTVGPGFIVQAPEGSPLSTTLPVATVQVGCVIVPTTGTAGVTGCALITTFADAGEIHPKALVTVKVRVPAARPDIVVLVPDPAMDPGFMVQLPVGKPLNTTLPVATVHVGCVIVPITGAVGVAAIISTLPVAGETQPYELVTLKANVPGARPVIVRLAPVLAIAPGLITQFPVGNPLRTTLPVETAQVGCVMVPTMGAVGVGGWVPIITSKDGSEIQPTPLLTVKV